MNNNEGKGRFLSEDRRLWIADWFLLHVITDRVCFIKGFHHRNCAGGWIFVFRSRRKSTQKKKVKKQENQLEIVAAVSTTETGNIERPYELWEAGRQPNWQIGYDEAAKMRASEIQLGKSGMRVLVVSSPSFPREAIHLALSQLYLLHSWEAEFLYLVAKCIKSNPATLSQLRSFSLEICPSANGAPDSVGEELRHCWAALG